MGLVFVDSVEGLISLPNIHCKLLSNHIDDIGVVQFIRGKGYHKVAQLYPLLFSKLLRNNFHTLSRKVWINTIAARISMNCLVGVHDISGHQFLGILIKVVAVSVSSFPDRHNYFSPSI